MDQLMKAQAAARVSGALGIGPSVGHGIGRLAGLLSLGVTHPQAGLRASKTGVNGLIAGLMLGLKEAREEFLMHAAVLKAEATEKAKEKEALAREVNAKKAEEEERPPHTPGENRTPGPRLEGLEGGGPVPQSQ
jgi:hypothetical protein